MNGCSNHAEDESADTEASSANIDESTPTTAKTTDTRPNAADEYIRIWAAMKGYGDASIADDSIDGMGPTLAEFLKAHQSQITEILSASKMERCDFSPVTGETGGRSYAGMREAQECAIILSNDAERFLQSGSAETAGVERLVAMGRMAQQMGKNRWLFSKVAAQASTSLMISRALKYEVRIVQTE
ncbi:MAG TPA: hypothetical protein VG711_04535, partial [Phycisphaerales bacterium]|nr:hypothetical protein [Phycisphaerales bacterium]